TTIDYLLAQGTVDPRRIAVVGASMGGFYAARAAAFEPRLAACVAWGGAYDSLRHQSIGCEWQPMTYLAYNASNTPKVLEKVMANAPAPLRSAFDALLQPPLLTTKLYLPPARSHLVPRPRLIERLNEGLTRRLTLISAPAGFGKTTLLSAWIPQCPRCVAWVSLDEGDNDPSRFWSYFISAVQMLDSQLGQSALRLL